MLQIIDKTEEVTEIGALVNPDIAWVSMVKNPSNRETFTYRRSSAYGGVNVKPTVVHKIITTKGKTLQDVMRSAPESATWLQGIKAIPTDNGENHVTFQTKSEDQFVPGSFDMLPVSRGETPAWVVVGILKDDADKNDVVTIANTTENTENKRADIPVSPKDIMNGYGQTNQAQLLGDRFYSEWWSFQDVMHGLLNQSAIPMKQRKAAIAASLDGFKAFLMMLLDSMDDGSTQRSAEFIQATEQVSSVIKQTLEFMRKDSASADIDGNVPVEKSNINRTAASAVQKILSGGSNMSFQFESREDFDKAVAGTVAATIRTMQEETEAKKRAAAQIEAKDAEIKRMADQIAALETKIAGLTAAPAAPDTPPAVPTEQQRATETVITNTEKPVEGLAVFDGFFESMIAG